MRNALYAGVLSLSLIACGGSKQTKPVTPANTQSVNAAAKKPSQDSDQPLSARGVKADGSTKTFAAIYFDYDSTTLNDDARNELSSMSEYLRSNQDATLVIEGHCDERGTTEYNLALGEGRARAARDYLVRLGVSDDRVDIMSYGKERPAVKGHGESAWAKNRRGELRPKATKQ